MCPTPSAVRHRRAWRSWCSQPTHLLEGLEYRRLLEEAEQQAGRFRRLAVGRPLLGGEEDLRAVARALAEAEAREDDGATALVLMGHGTTARCNEVYPRLEEVLRAQGGGNWFVGTVEADPALDQVLRRVKEEGDFRRVVLRPLMIVAGDHANQDMAGEGEDSWKGAFTRAGYRCPAAFRAWGSWRRSGGSSSATPGRPWTA